MTDTSPEKRTPNATTASSTHGWDPTSTVAMEPAIKVNPTHSVDRCPTRSETRPSTMPPTIASNPTTVNMADASALTEAGVVLQS